MVESQQAPYRVIDRRGNGGGYHYGRSNNLYAGATQNNDRTNVGAIDKDTHRVVSNEGRQTLMKLGRWLFANFPVVSGACFEQAVLSTENMQPQFYGEDKDTGDLFENWLLNWGRIMCVEGMPYDYDHVRRLMVTAELRDGDCFYLLTETPEGYPMVQTLPAHRCRSALNETIVADGRYKGRPICDGVILNEYRRALAYRFYDEHGQTFQDIDARHVVPAFIPVWSDQVRGFSTLAASVFDFIDVRDSRSFELLAQKTSAALAVIESNEAAGPMPGSSIMRTAATHADGQQTALAEQTLHGGTIRYFRAGSNSRIISHSYDRPGQSTQKYQADVIRDALASMGWSYFFAIDPSNPGGAGMRVIVEKINRFLRLRQRMVSQVFRRIHGYALSKAIKLGLLPESEEWWMWEYQGTREITADKRYDSDVDREELAAWMTTEKQTSAKRGNYWEDNQDQRIRELFRRRQRAKELAKDYKLTEEEALEVIQNSETVSDGKDTAGAPRDEADADERKKDNS